MPGGGYANLELYERLGSSPDVTVCSILGEGSFHQVHGGTTTNQAEAEERRARVYGYAQHYEELRGRAFRGPGQADPLRGSHHDRRRPADQAAAAVDAGLRRGRRGGRRAARTARPGARRPALVVHRDRVAQPAVAPHHLARRAGPHRADRPARLPGDPDAASGRTGWSRSARATRDAPGSWRRSASCSATARSSRSAAPRCPTRFPTPGCASSPTRRSDPDARRRVHDLVGSGSAVVVLGACADRATTARQFEDYAGLVGVGSYVVVTDTVVNGRPVWPSFGPGPFEGVKQILHRHGEFVADPDMEKYALSFNPGASCAGFDERARYSRKLAVGREPGAGGQISVAGGPDADHGRGRGG